MKGSCLKRWGARFQRREIPVDVCAIKDSMHGYKKQGRERICHARFMQCQIYAAL